MRDQKSLLSLVQSIKPIIPTTTQTGAAADLSGVDTATVEFNFGAYTDGTHTFTLEESSDNSTFTTVAAGDMLGTPPTVSDNTQQNSIKTVGYIGTKRYLRVKNTVTGSPATGAAQAATVICGALSKNT